MRSSFAWAVALLLAGCSDKPSVAPGATSAVSFSLPSNEGALVVVPVPGAPATVLDFFGPACEPCAKSLPALIAKRGEIEANGGRLVLVAVLAEGEQTADAARALARWGVTSPFLVDSAGVSLREAGVRDLPATMIVARDGAVRWRAPADATAADVVQAVRP